MYVALCKAPDAVGGFLGSRGGLASVGRGIHVEAHGAHEPEAADAPAHFSMASPQGIRFGLGAPAPEPFLCRFFFPRPFDFESDHEHVRFPLEISR
jgi:hypothetical protein